jgi:hypothetical protein
MRKLGIVGSRKMSSEPFYPRSRRSRSNGSKQLVGSEASRIVVSGSEYPIAPLTREELDHAYGLCVQQLQNTDNPHFVQLSKELVNCIRQLIFTSILRADPATNLDSLKAVDDIERIYGAWDLVLELTESTLGAAA